MSDLSAALCQTGLERLIRRVRTTLSQCGERFPYAADPVTGVWSTTEDGDWAGGYWIALLLLAYRRTGEQMLIEAAQRLTAKLEVHWRREDMFRGLMFYLAGARAWELTGISSFYELGLRAAETMCAMFRSDIGAIPIGSQLKVKQSKLRLGLMTAIDNVYICLLPLWWWWKQTSCETCWRAALAQLETTRRFLIRENGAAVQLAEWSDPLRPPIRTFNYQSLYDDGCWSRGQAFAMAGFAVAFEHTSDSGYLTTLSLLTNYYEERCPEDGVPGYDLALPPPPQTLRDTSAAAITAWGLTRLLLSGKLEPDQAGPFQQLRDKILTSLLRHYQTPTSEQDHRPEGMLLEGCFNVRDGVDTHHELIWGDYYLFESLHAVVNED